MALEALSKNLFEYYLHNRQQFVAFDDESRLYTRVALIFISLKSCALPYEMDSFIEKTHHIKF